MPCNLGFQNLMTFHPPLFRITRFARRCGLLTGLAGLLGWCVSAAEPTVLLEIQRAASLDGPWHALSEVTVPAAPGQEFFRIGPAKGPEAGIPSEFVWIPSGTFVMGTPDSEVGRRTAEGPQTRVRVSGGFWMSRHETTQRDWLAVMGFNNSATPNPDLPADAVSYEEALEYCAKVTTRERAAGRLPAGYVYRLPTEAEWEYACRAGTTTAFSLGDSLSSTNANFDGTMPYGGAAQGPALSGTVPGGQYPPNPWGLYDMHGNVWEWCLDWHPSRLPGGRVTDPVGEGSATRRALRGGGWHNDAATCRSGFRYLVGPIFRISSSGLRPIIARGL